ncbi:DnaJ C-terminal domain-containing protein [Candidatus Desulfovibrio trichonymphae]|uniref:Curved DNA-binding protein n=1 Tax=Candidatus Desulfovibrio trichonymphae TaxID=1725232 RepID=A0A1J1DYJ8_9BACT|nr:J domain-containing protein [Candidatus Desulfovibrio trichonymphae]BAV92190.1 curved DNA-binding protein [Candidatus Desulfovibrio trichonymphae]GHV00355.1 molecular chaperone DnaJ [Deltaproteobacteria bacterium]
MTVEYKDYYKLLGVERGADAEDVAKAFKKLARQYHPDLHPGDAQAEEKFKEVNEAYEVLKDPEKRRLYDRLGSNWQHGQQFQGEPGFENVHFTFNGKSFDGSGFSDFFETLFGGAAQGGSAGRNAGFGPDSFSGFSAKSRRGRDVEAELALSLEDVSCGGRHTVTLRMAHGPKTLEVNVPAGVREGAKLRLAGQGVPLPGGSPGDLFLRVRYLPHSRFRVGGDNLQCDVWLAPWEAALGSRVAVPTLDASVELNIPQGTSSGRKFRLRGKGLGCGVKCGDLLVRVMIRTPACLNETEQELWQKLAQASAFDARA